MVEKPPFHSGKKFYHSEKWFGSFLLLHRVTSKCQSINKKYPDWIRASEDSQKPPFKSRRKFYRDQKWFTHISFCSSLAQGYLYVSDNKQIYPDRIHAMEGTLMVNKSPLRWLENQKSYQNAISALIAVMFSTQWFVWSLCSNRKVKIWQNQNHKSNSKRITFKRIVFLKVLHSWWLWRW